MLVPRKKENDLVTKIIHIYVYTHTTHYVA